MIKNAREYGISKSQAMKFGEALSRLHGSSPGSSDLHPLLRKAQEDAIRSQFEELQDQIQEYESRLSDPQNKLSATAIADRAVAVLSDR